MPLDSSGYVSKSLDEVKQDLVAGLLSQFGPDAHADPDVYENAALANLVAAIAPSLSELHELAQAVYDSFRRGNAVGVQLDNLAGILGITRDPATRAAGTVTLTGIPGTVIPLSSMVAASTVPGSTLITLETVTIPAGGSVDVSVQAENAGRLVIDAGEVDSIVTPVTGWASVTNAAALSRGSDRQTDESLRLEMVQSIQSTGSSTDGSIRSAVANVDNVEFVEVVSNRTSTTVNGQPPKSFHVIVWPNTGIDEGDLAEAIFLKMPAGIEAYGTTTAEVTTSQGQTIDVSWSYATEVPMAVRVTVETNNAYPADGDDQIAEAVTAVFDGVDEDDDLYSVVGDGLTVGSDVLVYRIMCAVATVAGLNSITIEVDKVADNDPPTGLVNVAIDDDEKATIASDKIYVVTT